MTDIYQVSVEEPEVIPKKIVVKLEVKFNDMCMKKLDFIKTFSGADRPGAVCGALQDLRH